MEYAFVELMEDIGSDTGKYIGVGEVLPKGVIDRTQTFSVKLPRLFVPSLTSQGFQWISHIVTCTRHILSLLIWLDQTTGTLALFVARYQALLGEVGDVCGKNWMHLTNEAICTDQSLSMEPSIDQRMNKWSHCMVAETLTCEGACLHQQNTLFWTVLDRATQIVVAWRHLNLTLGLAPQYGPSR